MALTDDLISVWEMDEASGNAVDSHGSNTLTETSGTIAAATGKISGARDFELTADTEYFLIADNAALSTGDIDFSLTAWLQFESHPANAFIVNKWSTTSNREYALSYSVGSTALQFAVSNNGTTVTTRLWSSDVTDGVWYFVACGHSASSNEIWLSVDAATPLTTSHTTGVLNGNSDFCIGARHGNLDNFDGLIDQVAFWKRDIRSDRSTLYNLGSGLAYSSWDAGGSAKPWYYMAQQRVVG